MIEQDTAHLEGQALDWAVAKVQGYDLMRHPYRRAYVEGTGFIDYKPTTNWLLAGPLILEHGVSLTCIAPANCWEAYCDGERQPDGNYRVVVMEGETPQIAACRAIVAASLGEVVRVPKELV